MSTDPTVPGGWPSLAPVVPAPVASSNVEPPTVPSQPTPPIAPAPEPQPEKWAGRVAVPGASAPGQKKPTAPTQYMAPLAETAMAPRVVVEAPRPRPRRRSRTSRFFLALLALVLLLSVPVVSAYVAYKLASGGNPFEWPPTIDYDQIFGPRD